MTWLALFRDEKGKEPVFVNLAQVCEVTFHDAIPEGEYACPASASLSLVNSGLMVLYHAESVGRLCEVLSGLAEVGG